MTARLHDQVALNRGGTADVKPATTLDPDVPLDGRVSVELIFEFRHTVVLNVLWQEAVVELQWNRQFRERVDRTREQTEVWSGGCGWLGGRCSRVATVRSFGSPERIFRRGIVATLLGEKLQADLDILDTLGLIHRLECQFPRLTRHEAGGVVLVTGEEKPLSQVLTG
ncbi:hypothetical protein BRC66_00460 [Halobacteriales archaeon QH_2_66_30]|nr:MAG: hypothetical protein BRC66_00460 [Halobacteriales archaeon QH_2_66_30]